MKIHIELDNEILQGSKFIKKYVLISDFSSSFSC